MFSQIIAIARNTFVESIRQPVFFVLIGLCGIAQVLNTWSAAYSMNLSESGEVEADNKVLLDIGLATVFGCGALLAAFLATAVMSKEIERKTVLTVVSKPVGRPTLVLGKYLGVAGAILVATLTMLLVLLLCIRHGVMSTASDTVDGPALTFGLAAAAIAFFAAGWTNFFYGWNFTQTCVMLLLPLVAIAYVGVLLIDKQWHFQPIGSDFKPQITLTCLCLTMAILVLTAVATAASTRLGQVMTIVVCAGVFLAALLTNYFIGRHAFDNDAVAVIASAEPVGQSSITFDRPGDTSKVTLRGPPDKPIKPGMPFFYGPSPNGFPLSIASFEPFQGALDDTPKMLGPGAAPAIVVTAVNGMDLTIRNIGQRPVRVLVPPMPGDSVFLRKTDVNLFALGLWAVVPNMHLFWLLDAVSQNNRIPPIHVGMTMVYGFLQIGAFLSLAVILFQRRDVG